jgi:hypothetical protein
MSTPKETLNQEKESFIIKNRFHTIVYFLLREKLNKYIINNTKPILTETVRSLENIN